ncbi:hypothetical protein [Dehalococcoides mccartyi]|uniref:Uncharacterized protein n=1 Tax=Dehalococcoides mccartyi TaxID=61435 RepID=A0AB33HNW5_9CHLR|nr:hypothetical protein [Dehalococcoides mccartyi]BAS31192.1 hypothetical protein IBK_0117 [Dehalococcoides mccartyi IBARAKI]BAZ96717.1 hypothetical protein DEHALATV1_0089 [Dehalococcoides mccartyi]
MTGIELIAQERERQIKELGFDTKHDEDVIHESGELALAAVCYASPINLYCHELTYKGQSIFTDPWPNTWEKTWDKRKLKNTWTNSILPNENLPLPERIRNLVKAGALIAAEIDRLQRKQQNESH